MNKNFFFNIRNKKIIGTFAFFSDVIETYNNIPLFVVLYLIEIIK